MPKTERRVLAWPGEAMAMTQSFTWNAAASTLFLFWGTEQWSAIEVVQSCQGGLLEDPPLSTVARQCWRDESRFDDVQTADEVWKRVTFSATSQEDLYMVFGRDAGGS